MGAKTILSVALLAVFTAGTWLTGYLRPDYLARLEPRAVFIIGILATLVGSAVFHFWGLWRTSVYRLTLRLRLVRDGKTALELPGFVRQLACFAICAQVGLLTLDSRGVAQLREFPEEVGRSNAQYCPDDPVEEVRADDPTQHGCRLVRRAVELGYATSLGTCEEETEVEEVQACNLRLRDEPYLHYAWRLLSARSAALSQRANPEELRARVERFETQWNHIESLLLAQRDTISGAPRASHHVFTNAASPRSSSGRERVVARLGSDRCTASLATASPLLPVAGDSTSAASRALEHVFGRLVLHPAYKPVVGMCGDYTIHWGVPDDACVRLAEDPPGFLADVEALDGVRAMFAVRRRQQELSDLTAQGATRAMTKPAPVERVVSFSCLLVDPGGLPPGQAQRSAAAVLEHALTLDGHEFAARELRVRELDATLRGQIDIYHQLASLLAPGFGYDRMTSEERGGGQADSAQTEALLSRPGFLLSKAELMGDTDLFLGHDWLERRDDLLEVYPHHQHSRHFVELFRRHYRSVRGRLRGRL